MRLVRLARRIVRKMLDVLHLFVPVYRIYARVVGQLNQAAAEAAFEQVVLEV